MKIINISNINYIKVSPTGRSYVYFSGNFVILTPEETKELLKHDFSIATFVTLKE